MTDEPTKGSLQQMGEALIRAKHQRMLKNMAQQDNGDGTFTVKRAPLPWPDHSENIQRRAMAAMAACLQHDEDLRAIDEAIGKDRAACAWFVRRVDQLLGMKHDKAEAAAFIVAYLRANPQPWLTETYRWE